MYTVIVSTRCKTSVFEPSEVSHNHPTSAGLSLEIGELPWCPHGACWDTLHPLTLFVDWGNAPPSWTTTRSDSMPLRSPHDVMYEHLDSHVFDQLCLKHLWGGRLNRRAVAYMMSSSLATYRKYENGGAENVPVYYYFHSDSNRYEEYSRMSLMESDSCPAVVAVRSLVLPSPSAVARPYPHVSIPEDEAVTLLRSFFLFYNLFYCYFYCIVFISEGSPAALLRCLLCLQFLMMMMMRSISRTLCLHFGSLCVFICVFFYYHRSWLVTWCPFTSQHVCSSAHLSLLTVHVHVPDVSLCVQQVTSAVLGWTCKHSRQGWADVLNSSIVHLRILRQGKEWWRAPVTLILKCNDSSCYRNI